MVPIDDKQVLALNSTYFDAYELLLLSSRQKQQQQEGGIDNKESK